MPGGNTSSRKRPYRMVKAHPSAYDNHARAGADFFGPTEDGNQNDYIDQELGYPTDGPSDLTPKNVDGNAGFSSPDVGEPVTVDRAPKKAKGDATPGGGW